MGERIDPYEGMTTDQLDRHFSDVHAKHRAAHTFVIPLSVAPPSLNARLHWAKRARLNAIIRRETAILAKSERNRLRIPPADGWREVTLTLIRPGQRGSHPLDTDNLSAALKSFRDAMIDAQIVTGDGPLEAAFFYAQRKGAVLSVEVEVSDGHAQDARQEQQMVAVRALDASRLPATDGGDVHPHQAGDLGLAQAGPLAEFSDALGQPHPTSIPRISLDKMRGLWSHSESDRRAAATTPGLVSHPLSGDN